MGLHVASVEAGFSPDVKQAGRRGSIPGALFVFARAAGRVGSVGRLLTHPHRGGLRGRAQIVAELQNRFRDS
ncbi:MAG TPA: hypothetical protein VFJ16_13180 [Longimicrobium sp.]|nr:hypothetical protein [Longimicrobium sp.]